MGKSHKDEVKEVPAAGTAVQATPPTGGAITNPGEMFAADAGAGMEGTTQDSFAIPFLIVLQKGSPQVDETVDSGARLVEGAKAGMLFDNVMQRLFDGKTGVHFIHCFYKREYVQWGARDVGGGFKGAHAPEAIAEMQMRGEIKELDGRLYKPAADGSVNPKRDDRYADVRNHYGLVIDKDGNYNPALLSLTSTQIKKSKTLMSALAGVRLNGPSGKYTPATYASLIRLTTMPEQNDKGSWFGIRAELDGFVGNREVYDAAKAFHEAVKKGSVTAKYEDLSDPEGGSGNLGEAEYASQSKAKDNKF